MNIGDCDPAGDRKREEARDPERQPLVVDVRDRESEPGLQNLSMAEIRQELQEILERIEYLEDRKKGLLIGLKEARKRLLQLTADFDLSMDLVRKVGEITSQKNV